MLVLDPFVTFIALLFPFVFPWSTSAQHIDLLWLSMSFLFICTHGEGLRSFRFLPARFLRHFDSHIPRLADLASSEALLRTLGQPIVFIFSLSIGAFGRPNKMLLGEAGSEPVYCFRNSWWWKHARFLKGSGVSFSDAFLADRALVGPLSFSRALYGFSLCLLLCSKRPERELALSNRMYLVISYHTTLVGLLLSGLGWDSGID